MEIKSPYQTGRISASIHIQISWTGRRGEQFNEPARTLTISHHTASIISPQKLVPTQQITVHCPGTDKRAIARVIGLIGQEDGWNIYGLDFIDPDENLWDVEVPSATEPENQNSPLFLECASCLTRARVNLHEIQAEVFKARGIINLLCEKCASWTVWGLASHDASSNSDPKQTSESTPARAPRTVNDRKHGRVLTRLNACVRHAGIVDEVVRVKDVSRGGFRFVSPNYHADGSTITVAMPYVPNASNIFVSARIIWRREVPRLKRYEYGVTYSNSTERPRGR